MKLIIAIAHDRDAARVKESLISNGFAFTKLGSTGGFLRQGSTTLLIGVDEENVERAMEILKECCRKSERFVSVPPDPVPAMALGSINSQPVVAETGGGIVFVLDVNSVERF